MSKLPYLTLRRSARCWPCRRWWRPHRRWPRQQGQRDHRLRHRPLPALDRRRSGGLRPQAGERALPHSRKASARAARSSRARPGPTGRSPSKPMARPASTAARRSDPAGFTGCTQQLINQAFKERQEEAEGARPARSSDRSGGCPEDFRADRVRLRLLRRDPGVDLRFERVERHRSLAQHRVMEAAQVELVAQRLLGLRPQSRGS